MNRFKTSLKFISLLSTLFILLVHCATSNYYTAQTLKENESALSPGVDNILMYKSEKRIIFLDLLQALAISLFATSI